MQDPLVGYRLSADGTHRPIFGDADGKAYLVEPTGQRTYCLFATPGEDWCDLPLAVNQRDNALGKTVADEHRGSPRYRCSARARLKEPGSDREWTADVLDVSVTGIGLSSSRTCPRGVTLWAEIEHAGTKGCRLQIMVRHATPQAGDKVLLGCRFAHRLTDGETRALGRRDEATGLSEEE